MKILVLTTLFPHAANPSYGVFVENRLRAFRAKYDCDVKVVAPVPWFPFQHETFGRYAHFARAPKRETREGVEVLHPRYFLPPKIGMHYAPRALARCFRRAIKQLADQGWSFDFIDAHYAYPDGVAAVQVAVEMGAPVALTVRGSDVTLLPKFAGPRRAILNAVARSDAVIAVSQALKDELTKLGAPKEKIAVLRNGVDLVKFKPGDRAAIRDKLGLSGKVLLSAGRLIDRKGHDLVIRAIKDIPDATLLIAGDGEKKRALKRCAREARVAHRVRFLGPVAPDDMPALYSAADALVLASSSEGWPNVLLEAMACGAPCVASPAWNAGEIIADRDAGVIAGHRRAASIAAAIYGLLSSPPDRNAARRYAERYSWGEPVDGMAQIFSELKAKAKARPKLRAARLSANTDAPKLIVTVDTEEQFDWNNFEDATHALSPISDIDQFQLLCGDVGVRPLYLLTHPLLTDDERVSYFKDLHGRGAADCGLHLHSWSTPPGEFRGEYFSFQKNLPRAAHRHKLEALANAYEAAFGARARAHRAGRYGIAPADYALLADIGVKFDFSPSAGVNSVLRGGPDFSLMSNHPFTLVAQDWAIHVTPVCGARALRRTRYFLSQAIAPPGFAPAQNALAERFLRPLRLSPEGAALEDLQALTRRLLADKTPVLTFTLHSTSLTPGANPYARDANDVAQLLAKTYRYLNWFRDSLGGIFISLDELAALYENAPPHRA